MTACNRLLLVDDIEERAAGHARMLATLGETCKVAATADAIAALDMADILLVEGNALDLIDRIRRASPKLPVIALLDAQSLDGAAHLLGFDGVDLLSTPCAPIDYAAALAAARLRVGPINVAADPGSARRLLELTEQVARIARAMAMGEARAPRLPEPMDEGNPVDAQALRALIAARRLREEHLPAELFGEPAWDMLLDLTAARLEGQDVSVTDLTIAAAVPPTTALRYIKAMVEWRLLSRRPDGRDGRRVFIELNDNAFARMCAWVAASRKAGLRL